MINNQGKYVGFGAAEKSKAIRPHMTIVVVSLVQMLHLHWASGGVFLTSNMLWATVVFSIVNVFFITKAWENIHKLTELKKAGVSITFPNKGEEQKTVMLSLAMIVMPVFLFVFELTTTYIKTHQKGLYEATAGILIYGLVEALLMMIVAVAFFGALYQLIDTTERFLARIGKQETRSDTSSVTLTTGFEELSKASSAGFEGSIVYRALTVLKKNGFEKQMPESEIILFNQLLSTLDAIMDAYEKLQDSSKSDVAQDIEDYLRMIQRKAEHLLYAEDEKNIDKIKRKVARMKRITEDAV